MDEKMINMTIDGQMVEVPRGTKIIDACKRVGITVPTLCYLADISSYGSCGVCVVEVENSRRLVRSCMHTVSESMVVNTHTPRVLHARRVNMELLLANHPLLCTSCERNLSCELQSLAHQLGVRESRFVRTPSMSVDGGGEPLPDVTLPSSATPSSSPSVSGSTAPSSRRRGSLSMVRGT